MIWRVRAGNGRVTASPGRADGAEAVEVFRLASGRVVVAVLDVSMPPMSGRQAFEAIRQIDPRVQGALRQRLPDSGHGTGQRPIVAQTLHAQRTCRRGPRNPHRTRPGNQPRISRKAAFLPGRPLACLLTLGRPSGLPHKKASPAFLNVALTSSGYFPGNVLHVSPKRRPGLNTLSGSSVFFDAPHQIVVAGDRTPHTRK